MLTAGLSEMDAGTTNCMVLPWTSQKETLPKLSMTAKAEPFGCQVRLTMQVTALFDMRSCDDHGICMSTFSQTSEIA